MQMSSLYIDFYFIFFFKLLLLLLLFSNFILQQNVRFGIMVGSRGFLDYNVGLKMRAPIRLPYAVFDAVLGSF